MKLKMLQLAEQRNLARFCTEQQFSRKGLFGNDGAMDDYEYES
jgi:hypothetical protein